MGQSPRIAGSSAHIIESHHTKQGSLHQNRCYALLRGNAHNTAQNEGKRVSKHDVTNSWCGKNHAGILAGSRSLHKYSFSKPNITRIGFPYAKRLRSKGTAVLSLIARSAGRVPLREATEIEGHAVRAMYLMAGATDLYLETGEQALLDALMRLWRDMTARKMFITGGLGSRYEGESFGDPYELPSDRCYCETCAAIGSIMWNWRMLLATGQAQFADLIEQTIYNGFLSGLALDGAHFFYVNPLLSRGNYARMEWYGVPCCPPNIMRTIATVEQYMATADAHGLQVHLFHPAEIRATLGSGPAVSLRMETAYPWEGNIRLIVGETNGASWSLSLRIPGWAEGAKLRVNGEVLDLVARPGHYAAIERAWRTGDTVELILPMAPYLVEPHPWIDAIRNSLAIRRGPLLYCLEQADQNANVMAVQLDDQTPLEEEWDAQLLGGMVVIRASGFEVDTSSWDECLYRPRGHFTTPVLRPVQLRAIPYFAWGNRGANAMRVWIPRR